MSKFIKKCCIIMVVFSVLFVAIGNTAVAENAGFEVGDHFLIGQYNNVPVLWRYVCDDANGRLFVSDKVICLKGLTPLKWVR